MVKTMDLLGFIAELKAIEHDLHATGPVILEKACKVIQARAKKTIGTDQELWPALAPSTIADKQKHGYKTPAPLLRTGEMRDSIEYTVGHNEAAVGSNLERAVWHELGTSRMPPRSFLRSAAISSEAKIYRMAAAATLGALAGHGRNARDAREFFRLLRETGHEIKELVTDLVDDDEEK